MKNNRQEGNTQRKSQDGSATLQTSANKAAVMQKGGDKKKIKTGKLSNSVSAGQRK
jgi:hypothetical protein